MAHEKVELLEKSYNSTIDFIYYFWLTIPTKKGAPK